MPSGHIKKANNKGVYQTAQTGLHLCCSHATKSGFLASQPSLNVGLNLILQFNQIWALMHQNLSSGFPTK